VRHDDDPLPDYAWASAEPADVGLTAGAWEQGLPPIPPGHELVDLPDAPEPQSDDLVEVAHPRVRVMAAYWHEGWPHAVPGAWLRPQALQRVIRAVESLPAPFGLAVWDAWRDPRLQAALHDRVYQDTSLAPGFVAYPDPDPRRCPPHASGGTVDLTLTWKGHALSLGTRFDAFVPQAAADALEPDGQDPARQLRRLLAAAMSGAEFVQHPQEWWHWEFGTRYWAAVTGQAVMFGRTALP
jgi:D-alanyl-D-alanine dipeptidase